MKEKIIIPFITSLVFAINIYQEPSSTAAVINQIDPSHEYHIKTQDWVEVTDETTQQKGWAKLSELKSSLSANSQWSYAWRSSSDGNAHQSMHYKPFSKKDIVAHVKKAHNRHKRIMAEFESFWQDIDGMSESLHHEVIGSVDEMPSEIST